MTHISSPPALYSLPGCVRSKNQSEKIDLYMYVRAFEYEFLCMRLCERVCLCIYICMCVHVCDGVYVCVCVHACVRVCALTCCARVCMIMCVNARSTYMCEEPCHLLPSPCISVLGYACTHVNACVCVGGCICGMRLCVQYAFECLNVMCGCVYKYVCASILVSAHNAILHTERNTMYHNAIQHNKT